MVTEISTLNELDNIRNNLDGDYVLTDDIDATDTENWNNGQGWLGIGDGNESFTGKFDGSGYTISNLHISKDDDSFDNASAFFSSVGNWSSDTDIIIKNVNLDDLIIKNPKDTCGGLIGPVKNGTTVKNCEISGNIVFDHNEFEGDVSNLTIGGFIAAFYGDTNSKIENCFSKIDISANIDYDLTNVTLRNVGGFVGEMSLPISIDHTLIEKCVSENSIELIGDGGISHVGGFVGVNHQSGLMKNCKSNSEMYINSGYDEPHDNYGGFIGLHSGEDNGLHNVFVGGSLDYDGPESDVGFAVFGEYNHDESMLFENIYFDADNLPESDVDFTVPLPESDVTGSDAETNLDGFDFDDVWTTTDGYPHLQSMYDPDIATFIIENCSVDANISGDKIGGITGIANLEGTLEDLKYEGQMTVGQNYYGGIAAEILVDGVLNRCFSAVDVDEAETGGLVAYEVVNDTADTVDRLYALNPEGWNNTGDLVVNTSANISESHVFGSIEDTQNGGAELEMSGFDFASVWTETVSTPDLQFWDPYVAYGEWAVEENIFLSGADQMEIAYSYEIDQDIGAEIGYELYSETNDEVITERLYTFEKGEDAVMQEMEIRQFDKVSVDESVSFRLFGSATDGVFNGDSGVRFDLESLIFNPTLIFGGGDEFNAALDIKGRLNQGEVNTIEVSSETLGHLQVYVEGDVYRQITGQG